MSRSATHTGRAYVRRGRDKGRFGANERRAVDPHGAPRALAGHLRIPLSRIIGLRDRAHCRSDQAIAEIERVRQHIDQHEVRQKLRDLDRINVAALRHRAAGQLAAPVGQRLFEPGRRKLRGIKDRGMGSGHRPHFGPSTECQGSEDLSAELSIEAGAMLEAAGSVNAECVAHAVQIAPVNE